MHIINKTFTFSAGHTLANHPGKCRMLHGHNYKLEVCVRASGLDEQGMVIDFGDLKQLIETNVIVNLDHRFLIWEMDPRVEVLQTIDMGDIFVMPEPPTAEALTEYIFDQIVMALVVIQNVNLHSVRLWETDTSWAYLENEVDW